MGVCSPETRGSLAYVLYSRMSNLARVSDTRCRVGLDWEGVLCYLCSHA
jgi:hypothetical protein